LLGEVNDTQVCFRQRRFDELHDGELDDVDLLIGADICYSRSRGQELAELADRFLSRSGRDRPGRQVILADSGRDSFLALAGQLRARWPGKLHALSLKRPAPVEGLILHLGAG
jgi:hypothetical protein